MKTADVDLAWGLAPNSNGIPLPADKMPGGTLTFENRNLGKRGNQFSASVTAENFLEPNDEIGFKVWLCTCTCSTLERACLACTTKFCGALPDWTLYGCLEPQIEVVTTQSDSELTCQP